MGRIFFLILFGAAAAAQAPRIGIVDFYGLHRITPAKLHQAIGLKPGDPIPPSKATLEERIEALDGVVRSQVTVQCCDDGRMILYIGVEEKAAPHFNYLDFPSGDVLLPDYVVENYREFLRAVNQAAARGDTREDFSQGHSLMVNRDARRRQETFLIHTELYLEKLRQVLRTSANGEHRAVAAYLLGYARNKRLVIDDLQYGLRDPDDTVRGDALRALSAIASFGQSDAELGIRIAPTWFVEMLHSIVWSDRYRAAEALVRLTEKRDRDTLALLRERAAASVIEMARWRHLPHALPAFLLAGRMAGMEEKAIQEAWVKGEREPLIARLTASLSTSDKQ